MFDKRKLEEEVKNQFPEISRIDYKVLNLDSLEISFSSENICCVIKDITEKVYLVDNYGKIISIFEKNKISNNIISEKEIKIGDKINFLLLKKSLEVYNFLKNDSFIELEKITINDSEIKLTLKNNVNLIMDENTALKEFKNKYLDLISFLKQNDKNYSILDFRFEKIVVK